MHELRTGMREMFGLTRVSGSFVDSIRMDSTASSHKHKIAGSALDPTWGRVQ